MLRLAKLLSLLIVCFVVIGFWQGWFSVSQTPNTDPDSNKMNLGVSVDKDKMKSDVKRAEERLKEKAKALSEKGKKTDTK
jgi:hypothetical protein